MVSIESGSLHVLFDAGPFGWGGAGHSHADTLNVLVRSGNDAVLGDPGTFTYVADLRTRDWFRGTGAHNTILIDGLDQADPVRPFRWKNKPVVRLLRWHDGYADAQCEYRGFIHRRRIQVCGTSAVMILDDLSGSEGEHSLEQFWNIAGPHALLVPGEYAWEEGWQSTVYGSRVKSRRIVVRWTGHFPMRFAAALLLNKPHGSLIFEPQSSGDCVIRAGNIRAVFPLSGDAVWSETR